MVRRQLTLLFSSGWKTVGIDGSGTTPETEFTGRTPELLVANDQLSWPSVHHTHARGEETRVPQGPVSLGQELAISFTLRGNFLFFEAIICASWRTWITTTRCPGNQQVFLHIHLVACSAVGKFMVTASCNFKAPRSAPPKQILEWCTTSPRQGRF